MTAPTPFTEYSDLLSAMRTANGRDYNAMAVRLKAIERDHPAVLGTFFAGKRHLAMQSVCSPDGSVHHGELCECMDPRWKHKHDGACQNGACSCNQFRGRKA